MLNKKYIIIAFIITLLSGCTDDKSNVSLTLADTLTTTTQSIATNDAGTTLTNDKDNNIDNKKESLATFGLKTEKFDTSDLTLFDSTTIDLNLKSPITIKLYCSAKLDENNNPMFDDSNYWALIAESSDGYYEIFNKQLVQLGNIKYLAYFNENNVFNVLITQSATADYSVTNFTYDEDNKEFKQSPLLDLSNINKMAESKY